MLFENLRNSKRAEIYVEFTSFSMQMEGSIVVGIMITFDMWPALDPGIPVSDVALTNPTEAVGRYKEPLPL